MFRILQVVKQLAAILVIVFVAQVTHAQEISPRISFEYGSPLFISRAPGAFNHSLTPDTGNSACLSFGLGAEAGIGQIGPIGLIGQIGGIYSTGSFTSITGGDSISGHDWKLDAEAIAEWSRSSLSLRAGPWVSARVSGTVFSRGVVATSSSTMSNPFHYGFSGGITWSFTEFPLRPEVFSRVDLSELSTPGVDAFSIGISVAYPLTPKPDLASTLAVAGQRRASSVAPRVRFLVNRSQVQREVPLERVELHVKEYAMVDSANATPRVSQWVVESYHLPQLSVVCEIAGGASGILTISKDSFRLMETAMSAFNRSGVGRDTTDLSADRSFIEALGHLNIRERNRLVAEFRSEGDSAHDQSSTVVAWDTLVLPPVDTTRTIVTIEKKQFRFEFSLNSFSFDGGKATLDLLLDRMKSLLQAGMRVTVTKPARANRREDADLMKRIDETLGNFANDVEYRLSVDDRSSTKENKGRVVVVLDL